MITLSNGYSFDFCCAAGALGFDGRGYWWEQPFRWLGLLRVDDFTIITKTLTHAPRKGNFRAWCPWRSFRFVSGGALNSLGLPNMGYRRWISEVWPWVEMSGRKCIVSIQPTSKGEAQEMGAAMDRLWLQGIEVNLSCPNSTGSYDPVEITKAVRESTRHPVIAKLVVNELGLIERLSPFVDAFDLINTVPWSQVYPTKPSPLAAAGLTGGVSGLPIVGNARHALVAAKNLTDKPIISGGGIMDLAEVLERERMGASAFSLGTVFLRSPWRPSRIVAGYRKLKKEEA